MILICRLLGGKSGCGGLGLFYAFWFGGLWFAGWAVFKLACCWFAPMVCLDWCGFDLDTGLLL